MKKIIPLDDYNGRIELGDVVGSVTRTWGNSALRNGWKLIEIYDEECCSTENKSLPLQYGDRQD